MTLAVRCTFKGTGSYELDGSKTLLTLTTHYTMPFEPDKPLERYKYGLEERFIGTVEALGFEGIEIDEVLTAKIEILSLQRP